MLTTIQQQLAERKLNPELLAELGFSEEHIDMFTPDSVIIGYDRNSKLYSFIKIIERQEHENPHNPENKYQRIIFKSSSVIDTLDEASEQSTNISDMKNYYINKVHKLFRNHTEAIDWLKTTPEEASMMINDESAKYDNLQTSSGTLVDVSSTMYYEQSIAAIEDSRKKIDELMLVRNVQLSMMRSKIEAEEARLSIIVSNMSAKLHTLRSIMMTIDAYVNAPQKFTQILEGEKSSTKTLTLYNRVLFMDEEVGVPGQESINFENVENFFDWLVDDNYLHILNEKSITLFRIRRRTDYRYSDNPYINGMMNAENMHTYFVIRNGSNIWIWDSEEQYDELYPSSDYMISIGKRIEDINNSDYSDEEKETSIERLKHDMLHKQRKMLIVESIMQNTDWLGDENTSDGKRVSLLSPLSVDENFVNYQDTADLILNAENRPSLQEYLARGREFVKRGTRIIWLDPASARKYSYKARYEDKFSNHDNDYGASPIVGEQYHLHVSENMPQNAIGYIKVGNDYMKIKIKFYVYEEDNFLNYDAMTVADVDYYLMDRHVRRNYMRQMQVLFDIRKHLLPEKAMEAEFIKHLKSWIEKEYGFVPNDAAISHAIMWWKEKVIFTRPLSKDDSKAWRMISKKIVQTSKKLRKSK